MISLLDRVILLVFGAIITGISYKEDIVVTYILVGVVLASVLAIMSDVLHDKWVICFYLVAITLLFVFPVMLPFAGIISYCVIMRYLYNMKVLVFLQTLIVCVAIAGLLDGNGLYVILCAFDIVLGLIFGAKSRIILDKTNALIKTRDDNKETNMHLIEKNKYLLDNQEKEIHIATLSERNRIAREIHDNVGHILSRSILQLGAIMAVIKDETSKMMLSPLKESLDSAMNSIRESVHDLHKDSFDLQEEGRKIVNELRGYEVEYDCDISLEADREIKYCFLAILKEAITNIIKHSNATRVEIILRELDGYYQLMIEDNGEAKGNLNNPNGGIGLTNMRDRVENLNGIINITNDKGFRIYISVPKEGK